MFFGGGVGGGSGGVSWAQAQRNVAIGRVFSGPAPLLLRRFRGGQRARLQRLERAVIIVVGVVVERLRRRRIVVAAAAEWESGGDGGQHRRVHGGSHRHVWRLWLRWLLWLRLFTRIHRGSQSGGALKCEERRGQ